jgi:hypothetical protein
MESWILIKGDKLFQDLIADGKKEYSNLQVLQKGGLISKFADDRVKRLDAFDFNE